MFNFPAVAGFNRYQESCAVFVGRGTLVSVGVIVHPWVHQVSYERASGVSIFDLDIAPPFLHKWNCHGKMFCPYWAYSFQFMTSSSSNFCMVWFNSSPRDLFFGYRLVLGACLGGVVPGYIFCGTAVFFLCMYWICTPVFGSGLPICALGGNPLS